MKLLKRVTISYIKRLESEVLRSIIEEPSKHPYAWANGHPKGLARFVNSVARNIRQGKQLMEPKTEVMLIATMVQLIEN